jgi:hypothetical protein
VVVLKEGQQLAPHHLVTPRTPPALPRRGVSGSAIQANPASLGKVDIHDIPGSPLRPRGALGSHSSNPLNAKGPLPPHAHVPLPAPPPESPKLPFARNSLKVFPDSEPAPSANHLQLPVTEALCTYVRLRALEISPRLNFQRPQESFSTYLFRLDLAPTAQDSQPTELCELSVYPMLFSYVCSSYFQLNAQSCY